MSEPIKHHMPSSHGDQSTGAILSRISRVSAAALPLGGIGLALLVYGFIADKKEFFTSYTFAFAFWMSLTLGFTTLTYLHHAIRATWSLSFLRLIEAGNRLLPVMAVFFVPLALGMWAKDIYIWSDPDVVAKSALLTHKAVYLNPTFWTIRAVVFFGYWIVTTSLLNRSSLLQDETKDEQLAQARASMGAYLGVFHVLLLTLAVTDWFMSLDPIYYSTIYSVIYMMGGVLGATAIGAIFLTSLRNYYPVSAIISPALTRNVGNMLLGFTMFWAYTSLAQFLIQWCANLPQEISFYAQRFIGPLVFVGAAIIIFQFVTPFLCLISGRTKRTYTVLLGVALLIVFMRAVDAWWQITPFFRHGYGPAEIKWLWLDIAAWAGIGGIWVSGLVWNLRKYPLIVTHDPRLIEAKAHSHA